MNILVSTIDELYEAINNPSNTWKKIVLAAGKYKLDARPDRPNAGRLELLEGMELEGVQGHPEKVIIDTSELPDSSFNPPLNFPARRTGAIRIGRNFNSIEWLTVIGNNRTQPLSAIDTDLIWAGPCRVRIANSIITKSRIGIDIRNVGAACVGRVIEAEIINNELTGNDVSESNTQQGQGIVLQNANGASRSVIKAVLNGNYIHDNIIGMRVFNNNGNANTQTDNASITIQSNADKFNDNELGIYIVGGFNRGANSTVNGNRISFEANGSTIKNNQGIAPDTATSPCGIYLAGGSGSIAGNEASDNNLEIKLSGCNLSDNETTDILAFGASSPTPNPAGVNNRVGIFLKGVSKKATISTTPSIPSEPAGTNIINVVRQ